MDAHSCPFATCKGFLTFLNTSGVIKIIFLKIMPRYNFGEFLDFPIRFEAL
jgi:hypothetical protein